MRSILASILIAASLVSLCPAQYLYAATSEVTVTVIVAECSDGIDNDGNSLIDYPDDPGCTSALDLYEDTIAACADGIDNDSDGSTDFPADIGCDSAGDDDEYNAPSTPPSGGSGGSSGGGSRGDDTPPPSSQSSVIIKGVAYPGSDVHVLKDGQSVAISPAGPDAKFEIQVSGLGPGTYTFSVWASDSNGVRSTLYPFTVTLSPSITAVVSGVYLPPTLSIGFSSVRRGDPLTIIGQTRPSASVSVVTHSESEVIGQAVADAQGLWSYVLDTLQLEYGDHMTQARSKAGAEISMMSKSLIFKVASQSIPLTSAEGLMGDFNHDNRVNLADFSIMLYWHGRPLTASSPGVDLNGDGKLDLTDFSIFAYHWTG